LPAVQPALFLDGARLGYALAAEDAPAPEAIAAACDVFTVGGTKQGALFGEAVVITNPALQRDFRYALKQRGGMLAKGWLMGAQFEALLKDDLYLSLSQHANTLALMLRDGLAAQGWRLHGHSPSNQQFVWLPSQVVDKLRAHCAFGTLAHGEGECMVRFCTSWATKEDDVRALLDVLLHLRA
jgi:threonine aldolase